MSRLTPDGTAEARLARPNSQTQTGTGEYSFPCLVDQEQDWQPSYPVDPYSAISNRHAYMHTFCNVARVRSDGHLVCFRFVVCTGEKERRRFTHCC